MDDDGLHYLRDQFRRLHERFDRIEAKLDAFLCRTNLAPATPGPDPEAQENRTPP